ncbi:MAG: NAD-dependent epimerase/dehydratase family protein [Bacteroidetes bacterium]|nr:NAD-dependent epimerase/dehydratase family protein [Bacteroidota bacterium]
MQILITGANSFIGKNLKVELANRGFNDVVGIDGCDNIDELKRYVKESGFIFHLLTIHRTDDESAFERINYEATKEIVDLIGYQSKALLLLSSTQAENSSAYGQSKLQAEEIVKEWMSATGSKVYIFRLANEFGKWCPPNLNSVVATFCNNIASNKDIQINNPNAPLKLMYIDDIIDSFISTLENGATSVYGEVEPVYATTVGEVAKIIQSFQTMRTRSDVPNMDDGLVKKLYSTYLSYLPTDGFSMPLQTHTDTRGSFTELLHLGGMGQVSVNISKPGVTKGNHWHHTKNEKFIVIAGEGVIKLRKVSTDDIVEYKVSGENMQVVDIPPGYTHNITNTSGTDMVTIMWANEIFDNKKPDTYFEEV